MNDIILINNNASNTLTSGSVIPLGSAVHGYGKSIRLNGNAIQLVNPGYYDVEANVTVAVTGTSAVSVALYDNGNLISGAASAATPADAGSIVNLSIPWIYRKGCTCNPTALTLVLSGAGTVSNVILKVEKEK